MPTNSILAILPALLGLLTIGVLVDRKYARHVASQNVTKMNFVGSLFAYVCMGLVVAVVAMLVMRALGLIPASP